MTTDDNPSDAPDADASADDAAADAAVPDATAADATADDTPADGAAADDSAADAPVDEAAGADASVDTAAKVQETDVVDVTDPSDRLEKHMPLLTIYCDNLAVKVSAAMERYLRCQLNITAEKPTVCQFDPVRPTEGQPAFSRLYRFMRLGGLAAMVVPTGLTYRLVDILFGGLGDLESKELDRVLSPTEENMVDVVSTAGVAALIELVESTTNLDSELTTEALTCQEAAQDGRVEAMAVIPLRITMGEDSEVLELWFSLSVLELLLGAKLLPSQDGKTVDPNWTKLFKDQVFDCHLDLLCTLSELSMPLNRVSRFKVGDFIPLADVSEATFSIQSLPLFKAKVGVVNEQASASFTHWI